MIKKSSSRTSSRRRTTASSLRSRRAVSAPVAPADEAIEGLLFDTSDKHKLILAHAHARRSKSGHHRFGYVLAVAASATVVFVGWWLTLGSTMLIHTQSASQSSFLHVFAEAKNDAFSSNSPALFDEQARQAFLRLSATLANTSTLPTP